MCVIIKVLPLQLKFVPPLTHCIDAIDFVIGVSQPSPFSRTLLTSEKWISGYDSRWSTWSIYGRLELELESLNGFERFIEFPAMEEIYGHSPETVELTYQPIEL